MTDQTGNRDLLARAYAAYSQGNGQPLLEAMAEDVTLELCVPVEAFRFAGPLRGRATVARAMQEIREDYDWLEFRLHDLLVQGDLAVALTGGRIRHRATNKAFDLSLVDVVRMRGGKIVDFKEYFDSLGAVMKIGVPKTAFADFMTPGGKRRRARQRPKAKSKARRASPKAAKKARPKKAKRTVRRRS
jgi:ketosteroid isomerase-like protein